MDEEHCLQLKKNFIAIKALRHPSIIRYRALYIDLAKHSAYLVMEYFPCKNLLELEIKDESEMRYVFTELLNALSYMH
jgi:serine/threonine protein kinase